MNINILKEMSLLGAIFGLALGIIAILPWIGTLSFLALMFLSATAVIVYLKKQNKIGLLTTRDGAIYGAIIGFVSCIGFCCSMIPLASIIAFINHLWFHKLVWYSSIGIWFLNGIGGFLVLIMMIIFVGILSGLMNSFGGLATVYFYDQILNREDTNETFHIDN
ncbi:MAG: hypothetical protein PHV37_04815 [Candidatus Gastranaerophilales bacterium]|nr:hypothetical protein [Candidatus Gastranaerophilales bacterium]